MFEYLLYSGLVLVLVSFLMLTYLSFKQSFIWGILCFVISPLPFSFVYWADTKKYVVIMILGIVLATPAYFSISNFTEKYLDTAAAAIHQVVQDQDEAGAFRTGAVNEQVGSLVKCEDDVSLSASFKGVSQKFPITWTGVVICRFTKRQANIEIVVKQLESGEWEHVDTTVDVSSG
jgi:hypothetical protein